MSIEDRRKAAIRFVELLATGGFDELPLAPDFHVWTVWDGKIDRKTYEAALDGILRATKQKRLVFEITGTVAEGNKVAVEARSRGDMINDTIYKQAYHFVFTFEDDRIQTLRTYLDTKMVSDVLGPLTGSKRNPDA